jgi:hypothetical protein
LSFIKEQPNPLRDVPRDLSPEEKFKAEMNALGAGLSGAVMKQQEAHKETGRADYYTVICFEHADQVTAFLKATGYPSPDDQFIDGVILSGIMKIPLPPSPYRMKPGRPPDRTYASLVRTSGPGIK